MRPLTDEEMRQLLEKMMKFVGKNVANILEHVSRHNLS